MSKFNSSKAAIAAIAATALLLSGCASGAGEEPGEAPAEPLTLTPAVQELVDAAAAEGEVNLFVSTDVVTPEVSKGISDALLQDFGVDLKVNLVNGEPDPTYVVKLLEQLKGGQTPGIDLIASPPGILEWIVDAGEVKEVDWTKLGVPEEDFSESLHAVTVAEIARAIIYNTSTLDADEAPTSVEELLDPKWKDKIVTAALPDVFSPVAAGLGEDGMVDFTDKLLNSQNAALAPNPTAIRTQVVSGEYPIGYGIRIGAKERESGAPIDYAPAPVPVIPRAAVVLEQAKNPAAGELMAYWLSTENGKTAAYKYLDWTSHTTPGSDLFELDQKSGGVWSQPLEWWHEHTNDLNGLVTQLVAP